MQSPYSGCRKAHCILCRHVAFGDLYKVPDETKSQYRSKAPKTGKVLSQISFNNRKRVSFQGNE